MVVKNLEEIVLAEKKSKLKPPAMYRILLLNDDFTPMEFVIEVLQAFFSMNHEQAAHIMIKVHTEGSGLCGVYPGDVAMTKVDQVVKFARENQHPLKCIMEQEKN